MSSATKVEEQRKGREEAQRMQRVQSEEQRLEGVIVPTLCASLRRLTSLLLLAFIAAMPALAASAKKKPTLPDSSIEVQQGDTLRTLAAQHLGDAELWQEFLRANNRTSAMDVHPGTSLMLPPAEVIEAQRVLNESQRNIEEANGLRAKRFAPTELARAVTLRDQALDERRRRNWKQALSLASRADKAALAAVAICKGQQSLQAEAQLVDKRGKVEHRPSDKAPWKEVELYGTLGEGGKLRTQANAGAELLFRDESRLRMEANSQLAIEQMRVDLLESRQQAKVSLVSGDLFVVLGANRKRDQFDLEVTGVELKGDSKEFYVQHENDGSRFANYQGQLEVAAQGGRVTLEQNEGVAVAAQGLTAKRALLEPAGGLRPQEGGVLYTRTADLSWEPVEGAEGYWLEASDDASFSRLLFTRRDLKAPSHTLTDLAEGIYHWRVSAVDADGFPGARSATTSFRVVYDREPPFLVLYSPEEGAQVRKSPLRIHGSVEKGSQLSLNGEPLEPDEGGDFHLDFPLQAGANRISLLATDAAGNPSKIERSLVYEPEPPLFLEPAVELPRDGEGHYLALGDGLAFRARTLPGSRARLLGKSDLPLLQVMADAKGEMSMLLPLEPDANEAGFVLELTSPAGAVQREPLRLVRSTTQLQIDLEPEPPQRTALSDLPLAGVCKGARHVRVNGADATLEGEGFRYSLALKNGTNRVEIVATDALGNSAILHREVFLDRSGPEVLGRDIKSSRRGSQTAVAISVKVRDQSPLRDGAAFDLVSGEFKYHGALRLNGTGDRFEGTVLLPPGEHKKVRLGLVVVEDLLGNRTESVTAPKKK